MKTVVPILLAKKLKSLGFSVPTESYYLGDGQEIPVKADEPENWNSREEEYSAPTLDQVVDWIFLEQSLYLGAKPVRKTQESPIQWEVTLYILGAFVGEYTMFFSDRIDSAYIGAIDRVLNDYFTE